MSTAFDVAAAVAAELNWGQGSGSGFGSGIDFTATTKLVPVVDIKDLVALAVTVVPGTMETAALTRASKASDVTVEIGVQQKVAGTSPAECAVPAAACEAILDFLWRRALSTLPTAKFIAASIDPVYDPELLQKALVFCGVVKVTYRV